MATHPPYTFLKNGVYYYSRAVPKDLRHHYSTERLVNSLKTKSRSQAALAAKALSARLEQYWFNLRVSEKDIPLSHLLLTSSRDFNHEDAPSILEALQLYLRLRGTGKNDNFHVQTSRAVDYFVRAIGKRKLSQITSKDASKYRDWLMGKGLRMSSVHRYFSALRAITSFAISENGLSCKNPFIGVYLPPKTDSVKRVPVKGDSLRLIQHLCFQIDDEIRHLLCLISDTGMRLGEAVGLLKDDIKLDATIPHVVIREHPHRRLKTHSSKRLVPLVGCSLWAAKRVLESNLESKHCFPRYSNDHGSRPEVASGAFSIWLKTNISETATVHGLRHGFRDRLRDAKVPTEAIDQMGGWSRRSVGAGYGDGYGLNVLAEYMERITSK